VISSLESEENTIFLADVVAAERMRAGRRLSISEAWSKLPASWVAEYERGHETQENAARRARGLPLPVRPRTQQQQ
jgi:hypothetical protein